LNARCIEEAIQQILEDYMSGRLLFPKVNPPTPAAWTKSSNMFRDAGKSRGELKFCRALPFSCLSKLVSLISRCLNLLCFVGTTCTDG